MIAEPLEFTLRDALNRLAQHERKLEAIEQLLHQAAPPTVPLKDLPHAPTIENADTDTKALDKLKTPGEIAWPAKRGMSTGKRSPITEPRVHPIDGVRPSIVAPWDVLDSLDEIVWSVSPDAQIVFFLAGAVERIYGQPASVLEGSPWAWLDRVPGEDREQLAADFRRLPELGCFERKHLLTAVKGPTRSVLSRGTLVRNAEGVPVRVDGITSEIAPHHRTCSRLGTTLEQIGAAIGTDFLNKTVEHLATTFDLATTLIVIPDAFTASRCVTVAARNRGQASSFTFAATGSFTSGVLAGVARHTASAAREQFPDDELLALLQAEAAFAEPLNDAHGVLLGFLAALDTRPRLDGKAIRDILRALAPRVAAEFNRPAMKNGEVDLSLATAEQRARAAEAAVLAAEHAAQRWEEKCRTSEQHLKHARRLETLGRLVSGVSHDFNNLLTIISGNAELVRDSLPMENPLRESAELITTTAHTAAAVARQLVAFGRPRISEPVPHDLNGAIRTHERLLHRIAGDSIELDFLLTPALPPARTDPGQFDQVLLNLVANARDAIPANGMITIRTALADIGTQRAGWPAHLPGGRYIALTITDTGIGMTDEVKARAFDPYFTTKGEHGIGLGLANVREIVQEAGGHIELESSPAWGSAIRVFWPRAESSNIVAVPQARRTPATPGKTILVVQDSGPMRDLAVMTLAQAGYRVLEAADGESGEDRARLFAGPIHLLVADLGLPKVDGRDLARNLRLVRPELKVLLVSGAAPTDLGRARFLAKPYSQADLLLAVQSAWDEPT